MKYTFLLILIHVVSVCLSQSVAGNPVDTWKDTYYNFEYSSEADSIYTRDTLCFIQGLLKKDTWTIYWDNQKSSVATVFEFDKTKQTIITKHFNRSGHLIKELHLRSLSRISYPPHFPKIRDILMVKTYHNDSLICTIEGFGTSLVFAYKNPETKTHFKKRVFYNDDEIVGESCWTYYPGGTIKTIYTSHRRREIDPATGEEIVTSLFDCTNFDTNGCVIGKEK